jgi:acetolactate synthase II small subunit
MNNTLVVEANSSPEFLERLLRVCRHRGFTLNKINAQVDEKHKTICIHLTVSSDRDIRLLTKQIEKIVGVINITALQQPENIKASA